MARFILLFLLLTPAHGYSQYTFLRDKEAAGSDTAKYWSFKPKLTKQYLGDTLEQHLSAGIYRFVVNQKLNERLQMSVMDTQGEKLPVRRYDNYLEFVNRNRSVAPFYFTLILEDNTNTGLDDDELLGRLFFVYHKNILKEAPSFEFTDTEGNVFTNLNLRDKVVVINFWGTRCGPCIKEIPQLNRLVQQYTDRDDIVFLAITSDTKEKVAKLLLKHPFNYKHVTRKYDMREKFMKPLSGWPSHVVLNKEGKIVFQYIDAHKDIDTLLQNVINRHM